jgi:hypothetical protein
VTGAQLAEKAAAKAARRAQKKAEKKVLHCLHACAHVYIRVWISSPAGGGCRAHGVNCCSQSAKHAAKRSVLRLSGLDKPIGGSKPGQKQAKGSGKLSGTSASRDPERRLSAAPQRDTGSGTPGSVLPPWLCCVAVPAVMCCWSVHTGTPENHNEWWLCSRQEKTHSQIQPPRSAASALLGGSVSSPVLPLHT